MNSTRLPGKVLLPVCGRPILEYLVRRLKAVSSISDIVLATTVNSIDDQLEDFALQQNIGVFRGSEENVMSRVIGAAELVTADVVVEITGDCPIIDPQLIDQAVRTFCANNVDYVSNNLQPSYPDGMDTEVFKLETLKASASMTTDVHDKEHVSRHIRSNPDLFSHIYLPAPSELHWPELGLTLDEHSDYLLLKKIIEYFEPDYPVFSCSQVVELLKKKNDWIKINDHVVRTGHV